MVDTACVNTAAERQVISSTSSTGASVLLVQRSFTANFHPNLVSKQACIGFNGTTFLAQDCAGSGVQFVSLVGGELATAGGALQIAIELVFKDNEIYDEYNTMITKI
ncbi:hypothetical protein G7Y89_g6481 [Cudoniella acicularis]|uniref:Uncharacterized protein n=1 Tax=Cudoniella acicularis TaxID=354080 RepID=A0A8H4RL84_9HELO|nr:hypothetical protein G7Y89_g6481 [Cudoniella acicularis]